jgi:hypothetical protein
MTRIFSWKRIRIVLAAVALLAIVLVPSVVNGTVAGWKDAEKGAGEFTAGKVPAPVLTKRCQYQPGILGLGARVEIYWQIPAGYQLDNIVVEASTSGLGSVLAPLAGFNLRSNTTSTGNGTYTTEVPTNLLGGLLGLGSELEIAFSVHHASGWRSNAASVASNAGLIAGLGGSCRNIT